MKTFFFFIVVALLFVSCGKDSGVEPQPQQNTAIKGMVQFSGQWPAPAAEVRLFTSQVFPPTNINQLTLGEQLPTDQASYSFSYPLEAGVYKIIGVIWKPVGGTWELSGICGIYFEGAATLIPSTVTLTAEKPVVENVQINVNRANARKNASAKISGTVTIDGEWPANFGSAVVAASLRDPLTATLSLLDLIPGSVIPKGNKSFDYSLNVPAGLYKAVGVLFINADGSISSDALYFAQNVGGVFIGDIPAADNQTVAGPNFTIRLANVQSGVKGTVFFKGTWPAPVEEVRLIAAKTFPPDLSDLIIGPQVSADGDFRDFNFPLLPDTYKLVGVAWRAKGTNWDLISICGAYFAGTDSLAPGELKIESGTTVLEGVKITVDRSKARKVSDTKVVGKVEFKGEWPADITDARVLITTRFQIFPTQLPTMLDLGFSETIPRGTKNFDYLIKAFPGTFVATGVIFFKEGQPLTITDILYSLQVGGLDLNPYTVAENTTVNGPNFTIQF